jgi:hypothetical protein
MSNTSHDNPKGTTRTGDRGLKRRNFVPGWKLALGGSGCGLYRFGTSPANRPGIHTAQRQAAQHRSWATMMAGSTSAPIASEGMMFTDYYAEASCIAGRAAFIAGKVHAAMDRTSLRHPTRTGGGMPYQNLLPNQRGPAAAASVRRGRFSRMTSPASS